MNNIQSFWNWDIQSFWNWDIQSFWNWDIQSFWNWDIQTKEKQKKNEQIETLFERIWLNTFDFPGINNKLWNFIWINSFKKDSSVTLVIPYLGKKYCFWFKFKIKTFRKKCTNEIIHYNYNMKEWKIYVVNNVKWGTLSRQMMSKKSKQNKIIWNTNNWIEKVLKVN